MSKTRYTYANTGNWYLSTQTYLVSENMPFSTKTLLIFLMPAFFFTKNQHFFGKKDTFTESNSLRTFGSVFNFYKRKGYCSVFSFCKIKGY